MIIRKHHPHIACVWALVFGLCGLGGPLAFFPARPPCPGERAPFPNLRPGCAGANKRPAGLLSRVWFWVAEPRKTQEVTIPGTP